MALILIAFAAPLQLVSSVFGFLGRDVVAGTAMGVLAGTWLSVGLVTLTSPPGSTSDALGLFLLVAAAAMLVPAAAASTGKLAASPCSAPPPFASRRAAYTSSPQSGAWEQAAGVVGIALCAVALYTALAMLSRTRGVTRCYRWDVATTAAWRSGSASTRQLDRVEWEAGVRAAALSRTGITPPRRISWLSHQNTPIGHEANSV